MARHITITPVDDLDGSVEDVQTVGFTYKRAQYDIELSKIHRDELDALLAPYIHAARRRRGNPAETTGRLGYGLAKEIRAWLASDEGGNIIVKPTGRLKAEDMERFFQAKPEKLKGSSRK